MYHVTLIVMQKLVMLSKGGLAITVEKKKTYFRRIFVFSATFNNISVILWLPVLLVEETRVPVENNRFLDHICHMWH
jgi:hypothetical protein